MSDLFKSSNNISIGNEEIECISKFLNLNYNQLKERLKNNSIKFYFSISYDSNQNNYSGPPFIVYDLVIIYQKDNKFFTSIFSKDKYPLEYILLNSSQYYRQMIPFDSYPNFEVEYPISKICKENFIYPQEEILNIKKLVFSKINIPEELVKLIFSFISKYNYNNKAIFYLTDKYHLGNDIKVAEYPYIFKKKILLAIKV